MSVGLRNLESERLDHLASLAEGPVAWRTLRTGWRLACLVGDDLEDPNGLTDLLALRILPHRNRNSPLKSLIGAKLDNRNLTFVAAALFALSPLTPEHDEPVVDMPLLPSSTRPPPSSNALATSDSPLAVSSSVDWARVIWAQPWVRRSSMALVALWSKLRVTQRQDLGILPHSPIWLGARVPPPSNFEASRLVGEYEGPRPLDAEPMREILNRFAPERACVSGGQVRRRPP